MDVFKLLKQDHKEAKALFKKIEKASEKTREKLFQKLAQELTLHTQVEEEIFYPRLREEEKLRELIGEAYEEHHVAKILIQEISSLSPEDERWEAKVSVLQEMIEHHVQEEEKELFPKAAKALGKEESKELGQQVEAAKKSAKRNTRQQAKAAEMRASA